MPTGKTPFYKRHLVEVEETYGQHARAAGYFASQCFVMSLLSAVHAVFPFLFTKSASRRFSALGEWMRQR